MYRFEVTQKICEVRNLRIGGQPGELPTVLIGNVFYKGMPEVSNHKQGNFDNRAVSKWLELAEDLSEKTGVPHIVDVMAMYPKAICKYIAFISKQADAPFLIDGANRNTRLAALDMVNQLGLEKGTIFNGITPKTSTDELEAINNSGVETAVLMAYNELDYTPEGRINALEGSDDGTRLLDMAKKAGLRNLLIDTVVFDVPSISYAAETIRLVKEKFGYPAGCSPANATYYWKQTLADSVLAEGFKASNASAHTIVQCSGADFLIYGPIKQAKNIIASSGLTDAVIAYYVMRRLGTQPLSKDHPLFKMF